MAQIRSNGLKWVSAVKNLEKFEDLQTGKFGFKNSETGEIIISPQYDEVYDFQYRGIDRYTGIERYRALVCIGDECIYITPEGKEFVPLPYEI